MFFGYLSDRYGRKPALIIAILTVTISPAIGAYMPSAAGFGFFRFLMGKIVFAEKLESYLFLSKKNV